MNHKVECGQYPLFYPLPAILIGTKYSGKNNYSIIGNCGIVSVMPAVVYLSIARTSFTYKAIQEIKEFSINIPTPDLMAQADCCGLVSGNKADKSPLFEEYTAADSQIPIIAHCPVNLLCRVISQTDIHKNTMFMADVTASFASKNCITDGRPDPRKINPLIYTIDNHYWSLGEMLGRGFHEGNILKEKMKKDDVL